MNLALAQEVLPLGLPSRLGLGNQLEDLGRSLGPRGPNSDHPSLDLVPSVLVEGRLSRRPLMLEPSLAQPDPVTDRLGGQGGALASPRPLTHKAP